MVTKGTVVNGVLIGILVLMVFWGTKAYREAMMYEAMTAKLITYQDAEQQISLQFDKMAEQLLGDWYEDSLSQDLSQIQAEQEKARDNAHVYTAYFMCLLAVLLFSFFLIPLRAFTFFGSMAAMLALIFGLIAPILMVTIHQEVAYVGDIVLSFESKGVIGSIVKLYRGGDVLVAGVILLFSVLVPAAKIVSLVFVSLFLEHKLAYGTLRLFKVMGKWSMVDVFVVAVFLVYLTANKARISHAEVEVGLYFFLSYVIVSMLVSLSADKMVLSLNKT